MKPIIQVIIDYILRLILIVVFCFVFPVVLIFLKIFRKKLIEKSWDSNLSTYWNQRNEIDSFRGLYSENRLKGRNFRRLLFKIFPNMFKKKKEDQEEDIYPMW